MSRRERKARAAAAETVITADVEPAVRQAYGIHEWRQDAQYHRKLPRHEEVEIYRTPRPVKKTSRLTLEALARARIAQEEAVARTRDELGRRLKTIDDTRRLAQIASAVYQKYVIDEWTLTDVAAFLRRQGITCTRDSVRTKYLPAMRATMRLLYLQRWGYEASPEFPIPPLGEDAEEERAEA